MFIVLLLEIYITFELIKNSPIGARLVNRRARVQFKSQKIVHVPGSNLESRV